MSALDRTEQNNPYKKESFSRVQKFNDQLIFKNVSDKTFATYELSELRALPKSLFYDAATSDGVYRGLFAYYVLGKSEGVRYDTSEKTQSLSKITPKASRNPTAKQIISEVSQLTDGIPAYMNPNSQYRGQLYNVKDFIFCKYYGTIPNNRMLTLRRFAHPVLDSLKILSNDKRGDFVIEGSGSNKKVGYKEQTIDSIDKLRDKSASLNTTLPVAQLVTYFGGDTGNTINGVLGLETGLNFSMETQDILKNEQTGDPGLINTPYGDLIKAAITSGANNRISTEDAESIDKLLGTLLTPEKQINRLERALLDEAVTAEGPLSKKIFVNLNTVDKVNTRKQGFYGGIAPFTINFDYTLTSAGEINSKLLFLDLMTNILSVGTDYGQFLTPEIRVQQTTLGLGFPGGPAKYAQSITDPMSYIRDTVTKLLSAGEVEKRLSAEKAVTEEQQQVHNELRNFIYGQQQLDPNSSLYKSLSVMISDAFLKKIYYSPLMLSGYPTGEWHLTVGNPLNPIAMIGNLVCKTVKIMFNDDLGPDDFPTEMKVQITLEPGRQRHRGDWESMFNRGNGRLYLGQLISSKETTQAWINQFGNFPNNTDGITIYDIVNQNINTNDGTEIPNN